MALWKKNMYIIWIAQVISLMGFGLCLPFIPYYVQDMGLTDTSDLNMYTGLINSLPALCLAIMAPVWGYLSDKVGRKIMLLRAVIAGFIVLILMGLVTSPTQLLIIRCLQGLLTGSVTAATTFIASNTPNHRMSYALGFLSSSTFIGYSSGPAIGGFIADAFGYRITFFIGALMMLVNFMLVTFFVKEEGATKAQSEQQVNSNQVELPANTKIYIGFMISLLAILFILRMARSMFMPFLPLYVQNARGMINGSAQVTGGISAVAGFATAFSGIMIGKLGDRLPKVSLMRLSMIGGMIMAIPILFINHLIAFAVLYSLLMFVSGGLEPLVMSLTGTFTPANKRGLIFGIQATVASTGWSLSPIIGSYVSTAYGYTFIFGIIPLLFLVGLFVSIALKKHHRIIKKAIPAA